jgi:hypothetical protein
MFIIVKMLLLTLFFCCVLDVCSGGELPEVEIISLLEEQIPRYRLRADTLTQFTGGLTSFNCVHHRSLCSLECWCYTMQLPIRTDLSCFHVLLDSLPDISNNLSLFSRQSE